MGRVYRSCVATLSLVLYALLGPLGYLGFALMAAVPARDRIRRALQLQGVMRRAFALLHHWLRWTGVLDYDPRKLEGTLPDGPCIIIANHPSLDDVTTVMSTVPRLCTAINRHTFHRWWLRPLLEQAGQFSGGVANPLGARTVLDSAAERLRAGFRVLVFPEGGRSPQGQLRTFARGAFVTACRVGVPIVPILIRTEPHWLTRGESLFLAPPRPPRKRLQVLEILQPAAFGGDSRAMRAYAESMYSRRLGLPIAPTLVARASHQAEASRQEGMP